MWPMPDPRVLRRIKTIKRMWQDVAKIDEIRARCQRLLEAEEQSMDWSYPGWSSSLSTRPKTKTRHPDAIKASIPADEEDQFIELVKLWRLEHPEPPKPRQLPKGITQHESDPYSD
jgi:hypothetical protein